MSFISFLYISWEHNKEADLFSCALGEMDGSMLVEEYEEALCTIGMFCLLFD